MKFWIGLLAWLATAPGAFGQPAREVTIFFTGYVRGNYAPCG